MTNIINTQPYLRTTRVFPNEINTLSGEVNRAYDDIAQAVNNRSIGIFAENKSAVTGNTWYMSGRVQPNQTIRQIYTFTATSNIPHEINIRNPSQIVQAYGSYTDGTDSFGLIFGTSVAITGQISFYLTDTEIVFVVDAGAPALTEGKIVVEWLAIA